MISIVYYEHYFLLDKIRRRKSKTLPTSASVVGPPPIVKHSKVIIGYTEF